MQCIHCMPCMLSLLLILKNYMLKRHQSVALQGYVVVKCVSRGLNVYPYPHIFTYTRIGMQCREYRVLVC